MYCASSALLKLPVLPKKPSQSRSLEQSLFHVILGRILPISAGSSSFSDSRLENVSKHIGRWFSPLFASGARRGRVEFGLTFLSRRAGGRGAKHAGQGSETGRQVSSSVLRRDTGPLLDHLENIGYASLSRSCHDPGQDAQDGSDPNGKPEESGKVTKDTGQGRPDDIESKYDHDKLGVGEDGS